MNNNLEIKLENMGTVNTNMVSLYKGNKSITLYFSYTTIVGIDTIKKDCEVTENNWGTTTGKLLNKLQLNKTLRISQDELLKIVQKELKEVVK